MSSPAHAGLSNARTRPHAPAPAREEPHGPQRAKWKSVNPSWLSFLDWLQGNKKELPPEDEAYLDRCMLPPSELGRLKAAREAGYVLPAEYTPREGPWVIGPLPIRAAGRVVKRSSFFVWIDGGQIVEWCPVEEVPVGGSRLRDWLVWSNGREIQILRDYATTPDAARAQAKDPRLAGRDAERHAESGVELNRDIEHYVALGHAPEHAAFEAQEDHKTEFAVLVMGCFEVFSSMIAPPEQEAAESIESIGTRIGHRIAKGTAREPVVAQKPVDGDGLIYQHDPVTDPGPLADPSLFKRGSEPAANFFGGKYNTEFPFSEPRRLFRVGKTGQPLGQYWTDQPPPAEFQHRTDSAVKPIWQAPTGEVTGTSPADAVYEVEFPAGTQAYSGGTATQGDRFLGGASMKQYFIQAPWKMTGWRVISEKPIIKELP